MLFDSNIPNAIIEQISFSTGLAPTAKIDIGASNGKQNSAPLKFHPGTLLTIVEDGAFEYASNHLYFSIGGSRYQIDQQIGSLAWGNITGLLSNQTDLQNALNALYPLTGGTINGVVTVNSANAAALSVGANGATNPVLQIDASTSSVVTGLKVKGAAAAAGVTVSVISSGTNEGLTISAKGTGAINITPGLDSGTVFAVNTAAGSPIFTVDSNNNQVRFNNVLKFSTSQDGEYITRNGANGDVSIFINLTEVLRFVNATKAITIFSADATALTVGANGTTNPAFQVDASTVSVATGLKVKGAAAAAGLALSVLSSGAAENLTIDAKGSGTISLATVSTGAVVLGTKISKYNNINTAGWGVPSVYASARVTGQTAAAASIATYTVGAADGSFLIAGNILMTAFTAGTISMTCAYTDEGNTARTLTLNFENIAGTIGTTAGAAGAFEGFTNLIRAKASTSITIQTTAAGFTGTYNAEAMITQVA